LTTDLQISQITCDWDGYRPRQAGTYAIGQPAPYSDVMAFDEGLAERIRDHTETDPSISERKMFGGLCFMSGGNMCFGVLGSEIMVRVGPDAYAAALELPHAREMDFTGRSMRGMVYVDADGDLTLSVGPPLMSVERAERSTTAA